MSLILDALKRAERERTLGRAPEPVDVALAPVIDEPTSETSNRALILILFAALVLAGAVIVLLLLRGHVPAQTPAPDVVENPTSARAPEIAPRPRPAAPANVPPAIPSTAPISSLDDLKPDDDGSDATAAAESVPAPSRAPPPVQRALPARPQSRYDTVQQAPPTDIGRQTEAQAPPQEAAPDDTQTSNLREMPQDYRDQFPKFTIDVLAYNSDPSRRFVMVDGKSYHEGDTLAEGPKIVGIEPGGLVLDWQGRRSLYALNH